MGIKIKNEIKIIDPKTSDKIMTVESAKANPAIVILRFGVVEIEVVASDLKTACDNACNTNFLGE